MKILVVEDDPSVRKMVSMMLADEHDALAVEGVDEAVRQLSIGHWDVILTDYKMPGKTGIDLIECLLASGSTVPVILMTGQTSRDEDIHLVKAKVHTVLSKPFSQQSLLSTIDELVSPPAGLRQ